MNKDKFPLTEAQRHELDRRLAKHAAGTNDYRSWEEVKRKLESQR